jgi:hypothetical protein
LSTLVAPGETVTASLAVLRFVSLIVDVLELLGAVVVVVVVVVSVE